MSETISDRSNLVCIKGYNPAVVIERRVNGSDVYPGFVVTGVSETWPDVDLCTETEGPLGIALEHWRDDGLPGTVRDTPDVDAVYTDNATVRIAPVNSGMVCLVYYNKQTTTAAVYPGSRVVVDTTSDGYVSLHTFATTTLQLHNDWTSEVGTSIEYDAGSNTAVKIIAVII